MDNNLYIDYLNSLHNYNAQNENAYGERNICFNTSLTEIRDIFSETKCYLWLKDVLTDLNISSESD